jgi:WD40 repeat protein
MPRTQTEILSRLTHLQSQQTELERHVTALLQLLLARPQRTAPEYWATVREIHARTSKLLNRRADLADINGFVMGPAGYRWLVGDAWAGKTALVAEVVVAALSAAESEVDVVAYFASRPQTDADARRFLGAVVPQLEYLLDENRLEPNEHRLRHLWHRAVQSVEAADRNLLLVVDGLDEDLRPPDAPSIASLLPMDLGNRGHVLVTSRPPPELTDGLPELPDDVDISHPLRTTARIALPPSEKAGHLAIRARQELDSLLCGEESELVVQVFGVLTAAGDALAVADVATLVSDLTPVTSATLRRVRRLMLRDAARSLRPVGPAHERRYTFAHPQLLEQAQANADLSDPEYRERIHRWAQLWAGRGWPVAAQNRNATPRYLLDTYPATLKDDPDRLARLAADVAWAAAALQVVGVDRLLADLTSLATAAKPETVALIATLRTQATLLRPPHAVYDHAYLLRELCLGALELGEDGLAAALRQRLQTLPDPGLVPLWTSRRISRGLIAEFGPHRENVQAMAATPDGRVVSSGEDERVLLWDPASPGTPVELGRHDDTVSRVTLTPDGRVVSAGRDGRLLMWNLARPGESIDVGRHDGTVRAMVATSDGKVVIADHAGWLYVWDLAAPGAAPTQLGYHEGLRTLAAFADGRVVSGGLDGGLMIWDPVRPDALPTAFELNGYWVLAVAVALDATVVLLVQGIPSHPAVRPSNPLLLLWKPDRPGAALTEIGHHDGSRFQVAVTPEGWVVSGGDGGILLWNPDRPGAAPTEVGHHDGRVSLVAATPDGRVVSGGEDGWVRVWDRTARGPAPTEFDHYNDGPLAVALLPDGRVVSAGGSGWVRIWDPDHLDTPPAVLGYHMRGVTAVAVLPDGRVVCGEFDGALMIWDPRHPGAPTRLGFHDRLRAMAVAPDGRVVSGGFDSDGRLRIWDPSAVGAPVAELGPHLAAAVAVSPDSRVISAGWDGRVLTWNLNDRATAPIELGCHDGSVLAVAVSPDGRVISAGRDGRVLIWNLLQPGSAPTELGRHEGEVLAVAVSPDGRVVSTGSDRWVRIWDPRQAGAVVEASCAAIDIALAPRHHQNHLDLVLAHRHHGMSLWSLPLL